VYGGGGGGSSSGDDRRRRARVYLTDKSRGTRNQIKKKKKFRKNNNYVLRLLRFFVPIRVSRYSIAFVFSSSIGVTRGIGTLITTMLKIRIIVKN